MFMSSAIIQAKTGMAMAVPAIPMAPALTDGVGHTGIFPQARSLVGKEGFSSGNFGPQHEFLSLI